MRKLMFNGRRSVDFGVKISGEDPFGAPTRITQAVTIPGRNGAFIIDEGNYENLPKVYHSAVFRAEDLPEAAAAIKAWAMQDGVYHRLEDNYDPAVYRMARFAGAFATELIGTSGRSMRFDLTFDCMPQAFLKTGDRELFISASSGIGVFSNPTTFRAWPLIRVYPTAAGTYTAHFADIDGDSPRGSVQFAVQTTGRGIIFDAETTEAWYADTKASANSLVTASGDLSLPAGKTQIALAQPEAGGLSIVPRWWRL